MRTMPYSAAKQDLYQPWKRGDYFKGGEAAKTVSFAAELSRMAYCRNEPALLLDQALIQSVLAGLGFSGCKFFESTGMSWKGGTHCYTATGTDKESVKQVGLVVFRGTDADDPTDIGEDADFILKPSEGGGLVHTGFADALAQVRPELDAEVAAMGCPILFTGHSLGAALATLAANLYGRGAAGSMLYTFGSPRVGNSDFAATFGSVDVKRYVDCSDVVTRVPLPEMGYAHVGTPLYIDRDGSIRNNPSDAFVIGDQAVGETEYLLRSAWRIGDVGVRNLADHIPMNYVWAVNA